MLVFKVRADLKQCTDKKTNKKIPYQNLMLKDILKYLFLLSKNI